MQLSPRELRIFVVANGHQPFTEWMNTLSIENRAIIRNRLDRIEHGNFGDSKSLGDGVFELRIHAGPGYRVYYGVDGKKIILLLNGGDKSSQVRDIKVAKRYWNEYKQANK